MDYRITAKVINRPTFDLSEKLTFGLGIERVIFSTEPVRSTCRFAFIAVVIIGTCIVFNSEETPATVKADIDMQLFLAIELFDAGTVNPYDIADAFYLGTVLNALGIKHAVYTLKAFPRFVTFCAMGSIHYLDRTNVFVLGLVGLRCIHYDAVNVYLVLVLLKLA